MLCCKRRLCSSPSDRKHCRDAGRNMYMLERRDRLNEDIWGFEQPLDNHESTGLRDHSPCVRLLESARKLVSASMSASRSAIVS